MAKKKIVRKKLAKTSRKSTKSSVNKTNPNKKSTSKNVKKSKKVIAQNNEETKKRRGKMATASDQERSIAQIAQNAVTQEGMPQAGNIDQIRDILFGNNMRDYDKRFIKLEANVNSELLSIRDETRRLFSSLEDFAKNEVKSLSEQLKSEQEDREDAIASQEKELAKITRKLTKHEEDTKQNQRDLRQHILDLSKDLMDAVSKQGEDLNSTLNREVDALTFSKADRSMLAALFTEMAMRISGENNAG